MDLEPGTKRPSQESIVPMINVVFLLLIFFLMTSQIAPPAPVEVTAPASVDGGDPDAETRLFVDEGGVLYFRDSRGSAALDLLRAEPPAFGKVLLTADKAVEAAKLAALLRQLAAVGVSDVELAVSLE
ncbi:biopolymer transporter ExbD [Sedimentitalea sp. JM2-8]|uniref:Biopolymer transporter ExbD n=1 Tax=Sedimentitalea xiamensis TaxID=3050037 RepID=A0ABT7FHA2_9RHOB|nr:biopolymer transporter ExbD [Sedimentitalea xiamensis]MDK3074458.1 biopolymer transporter ExbD [Sedimentitalea xiamensis]